MLEFALPVCRVPSRAALRVNRLEMPGLNIHVSAPRMTL